MKSAEPGEFSRRAFLRATAAIPALAATGSLISVTARAGDMVKVDMQLGWLNNVTRQVGFNRNYWRQPYYVRAVGVNGNGTGPASPEITVVVP